MKRTRAKVQKASGVRDRWRASSAPGSKDAEMASGVAPGDRLQLEITSLATEGDGVGRTGDFAVFVPRTAPGDRVEVEVTESHASYARARLRRLLVSSPLRASAPCAVYESCGGCTWQHLAYAAQLEWKRTLVVEALRRIGHVAEPEALVAPTLAADPPWRYRHKMAVPFALEGGRPVAGFYANRSHRIVPFLNCPIQHPALDAVLASVRRQVSRLHVSLHDPRTGHGDLRHLVARVSCSTGKVLACLVTARPAFPQGVDMADQLMREVPAVIGVVQNVQGAPGNAILGRQTRLLRGSDHLTEELDGLHFEVSAPSFFQVSPAQAARLYMVAVQQAALTSGQNAFDLYAGVGTLSLFLARSGATVEAVEEVPDAIRDGRRNLALNRDVSLGPVRFHLGQAESALPQLLASGRHPDAVVLDPPRRGASAGVLSCIAEVHPPRIVYVSCNPATLARDIEILTTRGYVLREVQPVDMFPQTAHVEAAALLVREHA